MKKYNHIIYKVLFLLALLVGLNYIYKSFFFEDDIQKHSDIINLVRKVVNDKDEIIYLGESSNTTPREDDNDKRAISDFTADYFPSVKFGTISKEATHAGIYYELLRNIPADAAVKTVIVTLNLRSFDANWIYSELETPLQKSIILLKDRPPLYSRFLLSFKGYEIKNKEERQKQFLEQWEKDKLNIPGVDSNKTVTEWDWRMSYIGIKNKDGSRNWPLTELACHYIKAYGFQIDTFKNPRIKDFDKIAKLSKQRNWNLVLNLLAENVEMADSLVGKNLIYLMHQNRDLLIKRYNKDNVHVVDNFDKIHEEEFIDRTWTTEHYAERGRKLIAKNIAEYLKTIYPAGYVKVTEHERQSDFLNDCEGGAVWGLMNTLSAEQKKSGLRSSKIDKQQPYSVTFDYHVSTLPDSLKTVSIDFEILQSALTPESKLIIEFVSREGEHQWNGFAIKDLTQVLNKWQKVSYTYPLKTIFRKSDVVKVYVYNPENPAVYIDDLHVHFLKN